MNYRRKRQLAWSISVRVCIKITFKPRTGSLETLLKNSIDCKFLLPASNITLPAVPSLHLMSINKPSNVLTAQRTRIIALENRLAYVLKAYFTIILTINAGELVERPKFSTNRQGHAIGNLKLVSQLQTILKVYVQLTSLSGIRSTKYVKLVLKSFLISVKRL